MEQTFHGKCLAVAEGLLVGHHGLSDREWSQLSTNNLLSA